MWIAIRENATYTATVRKDGKFTGNYCHELLSAVFEWKQTRWPIRRVK